MAKIPASSKAAMDALMNGLSFYTMRGVVQAPRAGCAKVLEVG